MGAPIAPGTRFALAIAYHGVPQRRTDGTLGAPVGWISTPSGSYTRNQPDGASTWLPSNDRPGDKAATRIRVTVPDPFYGVASGALAAEDRTVPGRVSTTWDMVQPMAPSEVEVATGPLVRVDGATPAGLPMSSFVAANGTDVNGSLGLAGQVLDFYVGLFGPFPFGAGGLVAGDVPAGVDVDAQGRPLLSTADLSGVLGVRQHRLLSTALAHQWFGAAVTPARWQDVWLAEGFSTYARWLWMDHAGLQRLDDAAANALARTDALRAAFGPPDRPAADAMSGPSVADGGAVALARAAPDGRRRPLLRHPAVLGDRARGRVGHDRRLHRPRLEGRRRGPDRAVHDLVERHLRPRAVPRRAARLRPVRHRGW